MNIWAWCTCALQKRQPVALLLVVDSRDSSPGKAGAKMALSGDGAHCGTVGGGAVEHGLLKQARQMLQAGETVPRLCREYHYPGAPGACSGMVCGGEQTVLLYPLQAQDLAIVEGIAACFVERRDAVLRLSAAGLELLPGEIPGCGLTYSAEQGWSYQECLGTRNNAYIIGGGHVSVALSQVLAMLDFDITVIDARPGLATMRDNAYARQKLLCRYQDLAAIVPEGPRQFVFIMTHSHRCDELAVEQLAAKRVRYLGVLGSSYKIERMREILAPRLNPAALENIRAPMGLPVGSHTPAEIAVSIAAEVVQLLNE